MQYWSGINKLEIRDSEILLNNEKMQLSWKNDIILFPREHVDYLKGEDVRVILTFSPVSGWALNTRKKLWSTFPLGKVLFPEQTKIYFYSALLQKNSHKLFSTLSKTHFPILLKKRTMKNNPYFSVTNKLVMDHTFDMAIPFSS